MDKLDRFIELLLKHSYVSDASIWEVVRDAKAELKLVEAQIAEKEIEDEVRRFNEVMSWGK
jgi:hypothetical protein